MDPAEPPTPPERAPFVGSPVAQRILALVRHLPGLTTRDVADRLGLAWATVAYHRRRLERDGLIRAVSSGRRVVLHPEDAAPESPLPALHAMLQGQTMRRVALAIQAEPGLDDHALALRVGLPVPALRHHIERLVAANLVDGVGPQCRDALAPTLLLDVLLGEPDAEARDEPPARS